MEYFFLIKKRDTFVALLKKSGKYLRIKYLLIYKKSLWNRICLKHVLRAT